jgi:hypothetical protein
MNHSAIASLLRILIATSATLIISGCATPPAPLTSEAAAHIHRVAVVSQTAGVLTRQYTGLTVFGNEREEKNISDWNVDAEYESQIAQEVEKNFGLSVVKTPYPAADFAHVNDLNGPWDAPAYWGPNWGAIEGAAKNYCAANSLDAILVLARAKTYDFLAGSNQYFGGAGVYVRGPGNGTSVLHLIAKLALIDCTSATPLAVRTLAKNQNDMPGAIVRSAPLLTIPVALSRQPLPQWTAAQQDQIHADLVALPGTVWGDTLRSILPAKN